MDFNNASFDDLDQHAIELLVFGTNELTPILKGHLFIEKILETLITKNLAKPNALLSRNRLGFELKVDLATSLGCLPEKYASAFKAINRIRNKYAHDSDYKVGFDELNALKFDWEEIQVKAYEVACEKGVEDASLICIIFLCWKSIHLIEPK
jgi:hypothetical protein